MARYGVAAPAALDLADLMCCTYMKETERRVDKALVWCVLLGPRWTLRWTSDVIYDISGLTRGSNGSG